MSEPQPLFPLQFFDRKAEYSVIERRLPHWAQTATVCFLTWRTWDSMPRQVLQSWMAERAAWLRRYGINPEARDVTAQVRRLPRTAQDDFHRQLSARWEACLDECHGSCVLRRPELAAIVAESLEHFDGERYTLSDYVVMPNHVHVLASFADAEQMLSQCDSWKHYTAIQLNRILKRSGRFWQVDGFDHLVRSSEEFEWLRKYIAENPQWQNCNRGSSNIIRATGKGRSQERSASWWSGPCLSFHTSGESMLSGWSVNSTERVDYSIAAAAHISSS